MQSCLSDPQAGQSNWGEPVGTDRRHLRVRRIGSKVGLSERSLAGLEWPTISVCTQSGVVDRGGEGRFPRRPESNNLSIVGCFPPLSTEKLTRPGVKLRSSGFSTGSHYRPQPQSATGLSFDHSCWQCRDATVSGSENKLEIHFGRPAPHNNCLSSETRFAIQSPS